MRILAIIVTACTLLSMGCNSEKSDYDAGIAAYERGHYTAALYDFDKRANQGDPVAQFCLGYMFKEGIGVRADNEKARKWYERAAAQDYTPAMNNLAKMYYDGVFDSKGKELGKELWKRAAEMGNPTAQFNLGFAYWADVHPIAADSEDIEKVEKLLKQAANQKLPRASDYLGLLYKIKAQHAADNGDFKLADKWYEMQENSYKAADNMVKAEEKAAGKKEKGFAPSQHNLGVMYEKGDGVAQSLTENERWKEALKWYTQAAEQGHAGSQSRLGFMYYLGHGVDKDLKKTMELFKKAAEQGTVSAQNNLASMYSEEAKQSENERTAKLNNERASRWFLRAAQQGDGFAQVNLGSNFKIGRNGVPQDNAEAYYWYSLALRDTDYLNSEDAYILGETPSKAQNIPAVVTKWHENVGEKLPDERRNEIQEQVDNWKPKDAYSYGTGFYIHENYILTNAHVVTDDNNHEFDEFRIPYRRVELIEWDPNVDLALLYDKRGNTDTATFRSDPVYTEEKIISFGYPRSVPWLSYEGNHTSGTVSGLFGMLTIPYPDNYFQHTAPIYPGNSGGPVFDLMGNVVGVTKYGMRDTENAQFAIEFDVIKKFLEKNDFKEDSKDAIDKEKIYKVRYTSINSLSGQVNVSKMAKKFTVPVLIFKNKNEKVFEIDYSTKDIGIHELKQ